MKKTLLLTFILFSLSLILSANNNELIMQASNALVRMDISKSESILKQVDYSLIKDDQIKAFYFFILGKIFYYRMDYSRSIRNMKKAMVFKSGYREWSVYYSVLMSFMKEDFQTARDLLKRYRVDIKNFRIKKSMDFIADRLKEKK